MTDAHRKRRQSSSRNTRTSTLLRNKLLFINIASSIVVAGVVAAWILNRKTGGNKQNDEPPQQAAGNDDSRQNRPNERPAGHQQDRGVCRVYTKEPGFYVFVDGEPARDENDEWVRTPCAVTAPQGGHDITIARPGYKDEQQYVNVENETEVVFDNLEQAPEGYQSLLDAAYLRAKTAQPIPLLSLSTPAQELDPYITPDGLSLYFVSDRNGVKGIYHVARPSPYHYFTGKPEIVEGTRGYDLPASPGLSADSLSIIYTKPALGNIYCVSRSSSVGDFTRKTTLQTRRTSTGHWTAAQVLRDDNRMWRLYSLQYDRGKTRGFVAEANLTREVRDAFDTSGGADGRALLPLIDQEFEPAQPFDLRGFPPCLSPDGLRQYVFYGDVLKRATRHNRDEPFPEPDVIANFSLEGYQPTGYAPTDNAAVSRRRSYSITDDEQWLFYESNSDLFMLRVFSRPRKRLAIAGRSIPPRKQKKPVKIAKNDSPQGDDPQPKQPPVDPRTLPLPYPKFRGQLLKVLAQREYEKARSLAEEALKNPRLEDDRNLIRWDLQDIERTAGFWKQLRAAIDNMQSGDQFYIGSARVNFARFEKGDLIATSAGQEVRKKLEEMRLSDLIYIVDKQLGRDDPQVQLHVGLFRFYDKQGNPEAAFARFKRAGKPGKEFIERLAGRRIQQARHEYDRENIGRGLALVNAVLNDYSDTNAAETARKMIDEAYARTNWTAVGPRNWKQADGRYTAGPENAPGSLLRSPKQYENFVLRLEWKSDVQNGQGGVYFRYPGSGDPIDTAFKIQLADDFGVPADKFCTGSLFKVQAPVENAVQQRGQWNTLQLRVEGSRVQVVVNGRKVLETTADSENIPLKGYVALDGELGGITYRKTLLYELPKSRNDSETGETPSP